MDFSSLLKFAVSGTGTAGQGDMMSTLVGFILPLVLMVAIFYFFLIRPEKKRTKQTQMMLSNIQVGDEIITTGGIIGRVLAVKEDTVLMETGSDRTKIRILKSAIAKNNTLHDDVAEKK